MSAPAPAPQQTKAPRAPGSNQNLRVVVNGAIAIVGMAFCGFLYVNHQATAGGTLAGIILGHYFGQAAHQGGSDIAQQAVSAVSALLTPVDKES